MMRFPRELLAAWPGLYRHPRLVSLLADGAGEVDAREAAQHLLRDLAAACTVRSSFSMLASSGEFGAATMVLRPRAGAAVPLEEGDELKEELSAALRRAREEIQARLAMLRARAQRAGLKERPPEIDSVLEDRRARADALLDGWEERIRSAEEEVGKSLLARLECVQAEPDATRWRSSVERCVGAHQFDAARFLLDGGPTSAPPEEALAVPRPPEWPWSEPLAEVLGWAQGTKPAPGEFRSRWLHRPEDEAARALVATLARVTDAGSFSAEGAREFADALDAFLGSEPHVQHDVAPRRDGFQTTLFALDDPRLPGLRIVAERGAPLWVAGSRDAVGDDGMQPPGLRFNLWKPPSAQDEAFGFDARTLLRLLRDGPHRRVNFLREVGARSKLSTAIPQDLDSLRLPPMNRVELGVYASWLLDILNVQVQEPVLVDVLLHYSGGLQRLLLHLLRVVLAGMPGRRGPLTIEDVERAWRSAAFRDAARLELLEPLLPQPEVRSVLGAAVLTAGHPGAEFTVDDIIFALEEFWNVDLPEDRVAVALDRLVELRLAARADRIYRIPRSGVGALLFDWLPDVDAYVRNALDQSAT
jgi:hypothetical protein